MIWSKMKKIDWFQLLQSEDFMHFYAIYDRKLNNLWVFDCWIKQDIHVGLWEIITGFSYKMITQEPYVVIGSS